MLKSTKDDFCIYCQRFIKGILTKSNRFSNDIKNVLCFKTVSLRRHLKKFTKNISHTHL